MAAEHDVHLYADPAELLDRVAAWFAEGFGAGEGAVAIMRPENADRLRELLDDDERLILADADTALAAILGGSTMPSARNFARTVEPLLDRAGPVRAFGEMVDILVGRGEPAAADALEQLWNGLIARRGFSLLCAYRIADPFAPHVHAGLVPQIARTHGRVLGLGDSERMRRAVDAALSDSLGEHDAERIRARATRRLRGTHVPEPQLVLMWVSAHMPRAAERVLASAREHYAS